MKAKNSQQFGPGRKTKAALFIVFLIVAGATVWWLFSRRDCPGCDVLISTTAGGSITQQMKALYLIGECCHRNPNTVSAVTEVLLDLTKDVHVRSSAAIALGKIGKKDDILVLKKCLEDLPSGSSLRENCLWAINQISD